MTKKRLLEIYHKSETRLALCRRLSPTSSFQVDVEILEDSGLVVKLKDIGGSYAREHKYHFDDVGRVTTGEHNVKDPVYDPTKEAHPIEKVDITVLLRFGRHIKELFDLYRQENQIPPQLSSHPIVNVMMNQSLDSYLKDNL